jgi:hypothetical protein
MVEPTEQRVAEPRAVKFCGKQLFVNGKQECEWVKEKESRILERNVIGL